MFLNNFFPADIEANPNAGPLADLSYRDHVSRYLAEAREPVLWNDPANGNRAGRERWRFTWLRTFDEPVIVRLDRTVNDTRLAARLFSGCGGYEPGVVTTRVDRSLTAPEMAAFDDLIARVRPFQPAETDDGRQGVGIDGAEWILERVGQTGYDLSRDRCPRVGYVREIGLFLVGLTGWTIAKVY